MANAFKGTSGIFGIFAIMLVGIWIFNNRKTLRPQLASAIGGSSAGNGDGTPSDSGEPDETEGTETNDDGVLKKLLDALSGKNQQKLLDDKANTGTGGNSYIDPQQELTQTPNYIGANKRSQRQFIPGYKGILTTNQGRDFRPGDTYDQKTNSILRLASNQVIYNPSQSERTYIGYENKGIESTYNTGGKTLYSRNIKTSLSGSRITDIINQANKGNRSFKPLRTGTYNNKTQSTKTQVQYPQPRGGRGNTPKASTKNYANPNYGKPAPKTQNRFNNVGSSILSSYRSYRATYGTR